MTQSDQEVALRPEVKAFAQAMERVLRDNDWKGGWRSGALMPVDCLNRLREEVDELEAEFNRSPTVPEQLLREATDVANFALMAADIWGALHWSGLPNSEVSTNQARLALYPQLVAALELADALNDDLGHALRLPYDNRISASMRQIRETLEQARRIEKEGQDNGE